MLLVGLSRTLGCTQCSGPVPVPKGISIFLP